MSPNDNRRRHYWINPRFQGRYIAMILGLQLLTALVTALLVGAVAMILASPLIEAGPQWRHVVLAFSLMVALLAAGLGWAGVRVSHRICGPVYRIRADLAGFREGRPLRPIKLREHDQLQELAEDINLTLSQLVPDAPKAKKDEGGASES